MMPAAHTKHPAGRPALDARTLRALWFEEGDGVGHRRGRPARSPRSPAGRDMARGMPGYSRDVIGQTPFGWSLDDAMEGLGPRADRATAFWRWRASEDAWAGFQKAVLGHLLGRLGPGRPVLGRQRGQAAARRGLRAAADPAAARSPC